MNETLSDKIVGNLVLGAMYIFVLGGSALLFIFLVAAAINFARFI